jgi:hypothetical protein
MRQYCYFAVSSQLVTADSMAAEIGLEPDVKGVRGSRMPDPPRPVAHSWRIDAQDGNASVDEQLVQIVQRLLPYVDQIAVLTKRLAEDSSEDGHGGAALQVVRYFNDPDGAEEIGGIAAGGLMKLGGQQQLLGWHLDHQILRFMEHVGAELDVDEYG